MTTPLTPDDLPDFSEADLKYLVGVLDQKEDNEESGVEFNLESDLESDVESDVESDNDFDARDEVIGDMLVKFLKHSPIAMTQAHFHRREKVAKTLNIDDFDPLPEYIMTPRHPLIEGYCLKDDMALFYHSAKYGSANAIYLPQTADLTVDVDNPDNVVALSEPTDFYVYSLLGFVLSRSEEDLCNCKYRIGVKDGEPVCLFLVVTGFKNCRFTPLRQNHPFVVKSYH